MIYDMPLTEKEMVLAEQFDKAGSVGYSAKEVGHTALAIWIITFKDRNLSIEDAHASLNEAWPLVKADPTGQEIPW